MITPELSNEIIKLSESLRAKFSPPEFIPGCLVKSVTDVSIYATNNGWIEALCGKHNQQRVRWKSGETVAVNDFVDVLYFPDRRLFEAYGIGGAGAISAGGAPAASQAEVDAGTEAAKYVSPLTLSNYPPVLLEVLNTTGSTLIPGLMMYTTYVAGSGMEIEYAASSSVLYSATAAVVVVGGVDGTNVKVATQGRYTLSYSGTAPSQGDYLIFGTSGAVVRQTFMSPEVVAIAMAAGSGGLVDALLLCHTTPVATSSTTGDVVRILSTSNSDFVALINAGGSGGLTATNVPYDTISAGAENAINITSSIGKLVLWNSTRSTARLISSVTTGSDFITTVSSTDSWADNDSITIRSQTTVEPSPPPYFMEIDLSQQTDIPPLARAIIVDAVKNDTGAANQLTRIHPYVAYNAFLVNNTRNYVTNQTANKFIKIPLYNRRFCWSFQASGVGTALQLLNLQGYDLATP